MSGLEDRALAAIARLEALGAVVAPSDVALELVDEEHRLAHVEDLERRAELLGRLLAEAAPSSVAGGTPMDYHHHEAPDGAPRATGATT